MKKKRIAVLLAALLTIGTCAGCGTADKETDKAYSVVCTIFPQYDWVRQVAGDLVDNMELTLLLDDGVDLHSYQPTADDMIRISECDLFIYVGGESDTWVKDALKNAKNKDMQVINLLTVLGDSVYEEELVDGMQGEEETEAESGEEEPEYDEHVWLSLRRAAAATETIASALSVMDKQNVDIYQANADAYMEKLDTLDAAYQAAVDASEQKMILFGDRFPFRYLAEDYGLTYYAAFVGCSAETEASFETITFLAGKVDTLQLPVVLVLEGANQSIAETIISNTAERNQKIVTMHAMQSITQTDLNNGRTYLSTMEENLTALKEALK